ncbi:hypothetical protein GCM10010530_38660 [Kribbella aluminosa]
MPSSFCQKSSIFNVTASPETSVEIPLGDFVELELEPPGAHADSTVAVARRAAAAPIRCRFFMPVSFDFVGCPRSERTLSTLAIVRPVMPDKAQF